MSRWGMARKVVHDWRTGWPRRHHVCLACSDRSPNLAIRHEESMWSPPTGFFGDLEKFWAVVR
jgi:hypothetical protein